MANMPKSGAGGEGSAVRFISWNIKGLNGPVKQAKILAHLKNLKTDIAFLQETHLKRADHTRRRKSWIGQIFHSNFNTKSSGTAILIHKKTQFTADETVSDPQGRFIVVSGSLFHTPIVLVNIYTPNWDNAGFINKLISLIPNLNTRYMIFGGDLNCVLDPALGRSNPKSLSLSRMVKTISTFMSETGCIDPWRFLNPHSKDFSFFSEVHHSYSRIDYFFIDKALLPLVKKAEFLTIVESDHAPVLLDIIFAPTNRTP